MIIENDLISIMQGRLSKPLNKPIQEFPLKTWQKEIELMPELNINNLEWVVDQISYINNPIVFDNYNLEKYLYDKNITISAVSNDYFLDLANSYSNISFDNLLSALNMQEELVNKIGENKKYILVMPFIENASLKNFGPKQVEKLLNKLLSFESNFELDFALEVDINYIEINQKLGQFLGNQIFINLDVGNTVSFGFDIEKEIFEMSEFILNVHLKDRKIGGPTMPLGYGDTNIQAIIKMLKKSEYKGKYTLQFARNFEDDFKTIKNYLHTLNTYE